MMSKVLFTLFALASTATAADTMTCAINGAKAADDAINAGIFAWAATERCKGLGRRLLVPPLANNCAGYACPAGQALRAEPQDVECFRSPHCTDLQCCLPESGEEATTAPPDTGINCAIDIVSALQGVHSMINTILSATNSCGGLHTENAECGLAVSEFTASVEGFGASVAGTVMDCTGHTPGQGQLDEATDLGNCVGDLSGSVSGIFGAASSFKQVDDKDNAGNALHVMDAIASLGGAIAGTVKDCTIVHTKHEPAEVGCVADILGAFGSLSGIASAATKLAAKCPASPARLYEVEHAAKAASASNNSLFTAALPITAMASLVLGFVGGSRFAKRPGMTSVPQQDEEARDVLLMEE